MCWSFQYISNLAIILQLKVQEMDSELTSEKTELEKGEEAIKEVKQSCPMFYFADIICSLRLFPPPLTNLSDFFSDETESGSTPAAADSHTATGERDRGAPAFSGRRDCQDRRDGGEASCTAGCIDYKWLKYRRLVFKETRYQWLMSPCYCEGFIYLAKSI